MQRISHRSIDTGRHPMRLLCTVHSGSLTHRACRVNAGRGVAFCSEPIPEMGHDAPLDPPVREAE